MCSWRKGGSPGVTPCTLLLQKENTIRKKKDNSTTRKKK